MPKPAVNPTLTKIATVRFAPSEYARLSVVADERGISVSELIRRMSLGRVLPDPRTPRIDAECITELRRIGVNVNQMTHSFNRWQKVAAEEKKSVWAKWLREFAELTTKIDAIARSLR